MTNVSTGHLCMLFCMTLQLYTIAPVALTPYFDVYVRRRMDTDRIVLYSSGQCTAFQTSLTGPFVLLFDAFVHYCVAFRPRTMHRRFSRNISISFIPRFSSEQWIEKGGRTWASRHCCDWSACGTYIWREFFEWSHSVCELTRIWCICMIVSLLCATGYIGFFTESLLEHKREYIAIYNMGIYRACWISDYY